MGEVTSCGLLSEPLGANEPDDSTWLGGLDTGSKGAAAELNVIGIKLMTDMQAIRIVASERFGRERIFFFSLFVLAAFSTSL